MSNHVITVEGLGKKFVIGHQSKEKYTALRDVVANNVKSVYNRTKDIIKGNQIIDGDVSEDFWAIKDLSFNISQGDRVGIVGRNGAGKSTLLKLLSRITEPTKGRIVINGRVASLLEVGTGFHPELTGRENIFLNGAILGMNRTEIRAKFDEIVAFAEVERFLDTPVKRYSSGMYVRLAFAVAAHLEPEVLIVDEVLAVGDAQFQKKCLGKMEDVSKNQGRTVLFVSHNMGVISQLCKSAIVLHKGEMDYLGDVGKAIEYYIGRNSQRASSYSIDQESKKDIYFKEVSIANAEGIEVDNFMFNEHIFIRICIGVNVFNPSASLSITLQNIAGEFLSTFVEPLISRYNSTLRGGITMTIQLPKGVIAPNNYALRFALFVPQGEIFEVLEMICPFRVTDSGTSMAVYEGVNYGSFFMDYKVIEKQ